MKRAHSSIAQYPPWTRQNKRHILPFGVHSILDILHHDAITEIISHLTPLGANMFSRTCKYLHGQIPIRMCSKRVRKAAAANFYTSIMDEFKYKDENTARRTYVNMLEIAIGNGHMEAILLALEYNIFDRIVIIQILGAYGQFDTFEDFMALIPPTNTKDDSVLFMDGVLDSCISGVVESALCLGFLDVEFDNLDGDIIEACITGNTVVLHSYDGEIIQLLGLADIHIDAFRYLAGKFNIRPSVVHCLVYRHRKTDRADILEALLFEQIPGVRTHNEFISKADLIRLMIVYARGPNACVLVEKYASHWNEELPGDDPVFTRPRRVEFFKLEPMFSIAKTRVLVILRSNGIPLRMIHYFFGENKLGRIVDLLKNGYRILPGEHRYMYTRPREDDPEMCKFFEFLYEKNLYRPPKMDYGSVNPFWERFNPTDT